MAVLTTLLLACALVALYAWWKFGYFSRRGAASIRPWTSIRTTLDFMLRKRSVPDILVTCYRELEGHSYGGIFNFLEPVVMIRDPQVIRAVAVADFDHFTDRVTVVEETHDALFGKNLVSLRGRYPPSPFLSSA